MTNKDNKNIQNDDLSLDNIDDISLDDIDLDLNIGDDTSSDDKALKQLEELVEKWYITSFIFEKIKEEYTLFGKDIKDAIKDAISSLSMIDMWDDKEDIDEENKND